MNEIHGSIKNIQGKAVVIRGNDIDTDQIIPARYMKEITFADLGQYAFYDLRYDENGNKKAHPFNDSTFENANILLVNANFGCGSSREHAPQALMRSGIQAIIGESFAEIFAGNCTAMGVPPVTLAAHDIKAVMQAVENNPSLMLTLDLVSATLSVADTQYRLTMSPAYRSALIAGNWDSTSVLLTNIEKVAQRKAELPYLNGFV